MANEATLAILGQGVEKWNVWRKNNPAVEIDLVGADLHGLNISLINLSYANLSRANLSESQMYEADLRGANLEESDLRHVALDKANLWAVNLQKANLTNAHLRECQLWNANLEEANLRGANLILVNLIDANLQKADLTGTILNGAVLVGADIDKAKISRSSIYGISVWDLQGQFEEQTDLIISRKDQPTITVDNIEVAQFVYLLLNNEKIRSVIDTVTTKAVLLLGRFYEERKLVLDALKDALRERGFVPILFDFEPSKQRDLTETIQLLANMAKFVIADVTDAKSIPQELSHIIPFLPSVPVQPILLAAEREYAMFEHWMSFKTVLPEFLYQDKQDLLDNLEQKILQPINAWRKAQDEISVLKERIKELEAKKK